MGARNKPEPQPEAQVNTPDFAAELELANVKINEQASEIEALKTTNQFLTNQLDAADVQNVVMRTRYTDEINSSNAIRGDLIRVQRELEATKQQLEELTKE